MNVTDLYCGGGNFGLGLKKGSRCTIDGRQPMGGRLRRESGPVHTYYANLRKPEGTALHYGSVNDFLAHVIRRRNSEYIPAPGEVSFISAGSLCQGFSNINGRKQSEQSLRNCSLVASVAAYIDFYRPKYAQSKSTYAAPEVRPP